MDEIDRLMIRVRRTAGKGIGGWRLTTASARRAMALLAGAIVFVAVSCNPDEDSIANELNGVSGDTGLHCGYELTLKSGNGQEALAGTQLPNEVVIRASVTPGNAACSARPAPGEKIAWSVTP